MKIFLVVLTVLMVVAVGLFVKRQLFPHTVTKPGVEVFNPAIEREVHLQGAELDAFLKSDSEEAQIVRSSMEELQSLQK